MYGGVVVVVVVVGGGGVDADDDHHDDDDDVGDTSKHILELQARTFRSYVAHTKCIVLWLRIGPGSLDRNIDGSDRRGWIGIYVGWIGMV